jgi:hypothetical protein
MSDKNIKLFSNAIILENIRDKLCLFLACYSFSLFEPEDEGSTSLRNICNILPRYTT